MTNIITSSVLQRRIFTIRGVQVMVDRDLAELYQVETKALNQAVKRNIARFPEMFRFKLSQIEKDELVTDCDRFATLKHSSALPYVFSEQGVSMLSAVLRSETAIRVSIQIMEAFVSMRKYLVNNTLFTQEVADIKLQLQQHDSQFKEVFKAIDSKDINPREGIFLMVKYMTLIHLFVT